jgi:predicted anti-sigma-YlaC factor YlaD
VECREVREYLPAYLDEAEGRRARSIDEHLAGCRECSAELARYRELKAAMASLIETTHQPPAWLLGSTLAAVSDRAARLATLRQRRERLSDPKVVATAGAFVAAGVAGAVMFRRSRRRRSRSSMKRLRSALAQA